MKVRVKKGQKGFIQNKLWRRDEEDKGRDVITLKSFEHPKKTDGEGKPLVVSAEDQFSKEWMEKVDKPKAKTGPKPKAQADKTKD